MGPRLGIELTAGLALIAGLIWLYVLNGQLETQLAKANQTIAERDTAIAKQNVEVDNFKAAAEIYAAQASAAARAALLAGERRRAKLPAGHGPAVMNAWLRETFGRGDAPTP
jgi:hypothetical protein